MRADDYLTLIGEPKVILQLHDEYLGPTELEAEQLETNKWDRGNMTDV